MVSPPMTFNKTLAAEVNYQHQAAPALSTAEQNRRKLISNSSLEVRILTAIWIFSPKVFYHSSMAVYCFSLSNNNRGGGRLRTPPLIFDEKIGKA